MPGGVDDTSKADEPYINASSALNDASLTRSVRSASGPKQLARLMAEQSLC
jgi:hypothetical protein